MLSDETISRFIDRQLKYEEGYRQFAYDDATGLEVKAPVGSLSLGLGWNIQDNGIPLEIAVYVARFYLRKADAALTKDLDFYDKLDDVRKCVLIDCSFNMGIHGLETFKTTLNLVSKGFYKNAAAQMRKSLWYSQVPHRAEPLCVEMETGQWAKEYAGN